MIDVTVQRSTPVIDMLDHFQATITIIAPLPTLKAIFATIAALTVLYLMQANTRLAGFDTPIGRIRMVQRAAMAALSLALIMVASVSVLDITQFNDLLFVAVMIPLWAMVMCSILISRHRIHHSDPNSDEAVKVRQDAT